MADAPLTRSPPAAPITRGPVLRDELLTPAELAAELRIPAKTLEQWRWRKTGPSYLKLGHHVRYRRSDIEAFKRASLNFAGDAS